MASNWFLDVIRVGTVDVVPVRVHGIRATRRRHQEGARPRTNDQWRSSDACKQERLRDKTMRERLAELSVDRNVTKGISGSDYPMTHANERSASCIIDGVNRARNLSRYILTTDKCP